MAFPSSRSFSAKARNSSIRAICCSCVGILARLFTTSSRANLYIAWKNPVFAIKMASKASFTVEIHFTVPASFFILRV